MRRKVFLSALAALVLCASCSSIAVVSEEDAYIAAMDSFNKKDFDKAGPLLSDFYSRYAGSKYRPSVMIKMAELEQDFPKAEELYKAVIREKPDTEYEAEAVMSLAKLYFASGEYVKADEYCGIIMGRFPNTVWIEPAYHTRMLAMNALKKYGDTATLFTQYSSNNNFFMFRDRVKLAHAESLYAQGKYAEAVPYLSQVLADIDREKYIYGPDVYAKIISCYRNMDDASNAEKYLYDLKQKYPDSTEAKAGGPVMQQATEAAAAPVTAKPVPTKAAAAAGGRFFTVQVGAYTNDKLAQDTAARLRKEGFYVFTKNEGKYIKIMVGREATRPAAEKVALEVVKKDRQIKSYFIKEGWE